MTINIYLLGTVGEKQISLQEQKRENEISQKRSSEMFSSRVDYNLDNIRALGYTYIVQILNGLYKSIASSEHSYTHPNLILRSENQILHLSVFECKKTIELIDKYLGTPTIQASKDKYFFVHIRKKAQEHYVPFKYSEKVSHKCKETQQKSADIILLSDLFGEEKSAFDHLENSVPGFSEKIETYKNRVRSHLGSLTHPRFAELFNTIFNIYNIIIYTQHEIKFPKEYIDSEIQLLSVFECQYLLSCIDNGVCLGFLKKDHRCDYLYYIARYLKQRKYALQDGDEGDRMS